MSTGQSHTQVLRMAIKVVCAFAIYAFIAGPALAQSKPQGAEVARSQSHSLAERVAYLEKWSNLLRRTAASPLPQNLSSAERAEAERYVKWLQVSANRIDRLAAQGRKALQAAPSTGAQTSLGESFDMQYLQLQSQMQHENRSYTAISNIMKTKHDTVKNSIQNVR